MSLERFAWFVVFPLVVLLFADSSRLAAAEPKSFSPKDLEFFEQKVRPLLSARCWECHGEDAQEGGLRLDRLANILKGGDSGPAVVPGDPESGYLIDAVRYGDVYQMPPSGKLPKAEVAILTEWVKRGAPWPAHSDAHETLAEEGFDIKARRASHWSWHSIKRPKLPTVQAESWPTQPIDHFILANLEKHNLRPAPKAERSTWLRRVYADLLGLPVPPEALKRFLADQSDKAYERVVDELLQSPQFGERWARHWLDLVRYAETKGHEFDYPIPNVHHYRDYVVRALNADLRYDQFVIEHLAGDLLSSPRVNPEQGFNESVLGTGFWFLGEEVHSPVDIRADEADRIDNKLDVFGKTFLGLTIACARCHDHKFDAISTKDYYSLSGFLISSRYHQVRFETDHKNRMVAEQLDAFDDSATTRLATYVKQVSQQELAQVADYLLAARELHFATHATDAETEPVAIEIAEQRQLSAAKIQRWLKHLKGVPVKSTDHPLHFWAKALSEKDWQPTQTKSSIPEATSKVHTIVDYGQLKPQQWLTDGFAFGLSPRQPGDLLWNNPNSSSVRICTTSQAFFDPAWDIQLAEGTEKDPGKLGQWVRAGKTLHTQTFLVPEQKLHYLIKGSVDIYASVNSHHLVNGPLHGALIKRWVAKDDRWHWVTQDITKYAGHRVHIEFTPRATKEGTTDCAIARVVASDAPPQASGLIDPLAHKQTAQLAAEAFAEEMRQTLDAYADGTLDQLAAPDRAARKIQWLLSTDSPLEVAAKAQPVIDRLSQQRKALCSQIQRESRTAPAILDGNGVDGYVMVRGNPKITGESAPRQFLQAMHELAIPESLQGSGRLELAQRIVDPANPYVSRVYVNRIWHHLFGRGMVATVDNFGVLGEPPTHPELLDYLADWFLANDWSLKKTIRMLVLSQTYQMSSQAILGQQELDPTNRWLHHMPIKRLQAEAIRDSMLAASGRLDLTVGGKSVPIHLTPFMDGRGRPSKSGPLDGNGRRSLYIAVRRNFLSPMMLAFDAPAPFSSVGRRMVSNVPAQALTLMNDPFVVGQAKVWAEKTIRNHDGETARIEALYLQAFARKPEPAEVKACLAFVQQQVKDYQADKSEAELAAWSDLCHTLINSKEFIFIP